MIIENNVLVKVSDEDITNGTFTIPDNIISIKEKAFFNCSSLTNITIPDSVTSIGRCAFYYCNSLTSITIPNNVMSIGEYAFSWCSSLTSIKMGSGVTSIGDLAFECCSNLMSVLISDSVTSIGSSAFYGCKYLISKKSNYKAFRIRGGELYCLSKKYIEGIENLVAGDLELCRNGIHYCTNLFEIFNYYSGKLDEDIAIYEIEVGDKVLTSDSSKCCTNSCILKKRLYKEDIIKILNGEEV